MEVRFDMQNMRLKVTNDEKLNGYFKLKKCNQIRFSIGEMYCPFLEKNDNSYSTNYGQYYVSQENVAAGRFGTRFVDYDYDFTQIGLSFNNDTMLFHETFEVEDKIRSLGGNKYFVQIASVLGSQMHIPKHLREKRTLDLRLDAQLVYKTKLKIVEPDNYEISNLSDLTKEFENDIGVFTTEVKKMDGFYYLYITESYKSNIYASDKWADAIKFTDYIYDYYKQAFVLSKSI